MSNEIVFISEKGAPLSIGDVDGNADVLDKRYYSSAIAPTTDNDSTQGFKAGRSMWFIPSTNTLYKCTDDTVATAVWEEVIVESVPSGGTTGQVLSKISDDDYDAQWVSFQASGSSELEKITENGQTGWRLLGRDPANYGGIGDNAVDLSYSSSSSTTMGATGEDSHAEGRSTTASGYASHAEGYYTTASGYCSHAEGYKTTASGYYSHAEGRSTTASGYCSHAEGYYTTASGYCSHAEGYYTTSPNQYMHSAGKYNTGTSIDTIHETGIGVDDASKKNAFEIYTDGTLTAPEATPALVASRGTQTLVPISYLLSAEFGNSLPTSDPAVAGKPWNNAGILTISQG